MNEGTGPNVTPGRPKGSGRRAPWIVLGVAGFTSLVVVIIAIAIALFFLL